MAPADTTILRTVERKVDKEGIEAAKLDVLVIRGHVILTGLMLTRMTQKPLSGPERERFRRELERIDGVTEVTFHLSETKGTGHM